MKSTRTPWRGMLLLMCCAAFVFSACETRQTTTTREPWPTLSAATWADMTAQQLHELLADHDINATDSVQGETALMMAARYVLDPEQIHILLEAGADLDERNNEGETALMLAVTHSESFDIVQAFLNARRFCQPR